jgi:UDP-glucuronate decarboxylase
LTADWFIAAASADGGFDGAKVTRRASWRQRAKAGRTAIGV